MVYIKTNCRRGKGRGYFFLLRMASADGTKVFFYNCFSLPVGLWVCGQMAAAGTKWKLGLGDEWGCICAALLLGLLSVTSVVMVHRFSLSQHRWLHCVFKGRHPRVFIILLTLLFLIQTTDVVFVPLLLVYNLIVTIIFLTTAQTLNIITECSLYHRSQFCNQLFTQKSVSLKWTNL